jgi:hypothetical protein
MLQFFIAHYYKGTRCSLAGSGTRNRQLRKAKQIDWGLPKKTDRLAIAKKSLDDCNHCRAAGLTMRCVVRVGTECETCVCGMPMANHSLCLNFLPRIA